MFHEHFIWFIIFFYNTWMAQLETKSLYTSNSAMNAGLLAPVDNIQFIILLKIYTVTCQQYLVYIDYDDYDGYFSIWQCLVGRISYFNAKNQYTALLNFILKRDAANEHNCDVINTDIKRKRDRARTLREFFFYLNFFLRFSHYEKMMVVWNLSKFVWLKLLKGPATTSDDNKTYLVFIQKHCMMPPLASYHEHAARKVRVLFLMDAMIPISS